MRAPRPLWLRLSLLLGLLISAAAAAQPAAAPKPDAVALLAAERDLGTAAAAMRPLDGAGDVAALYAAAQAAFDRLIGGIARHLQRNEPPAQAEIAALARDAATARQALLSGLANALPLEQRRQIARNAQVLRPDELATALPAALPALWATWQSASPAQRQQLLAQLDAQRWPPPPPAP